MARTKATVKSLPFNTKRLPRCVVNREYCKTRTIYPFKIKETLPEQKAKKNGQRIKTINVKRKSKYFIVEIDSYFNARNFIVFLTKIY